MSLNSWNIPPDEERYADCDQCSQRFTGDAAIRSYLREVERDDGEAVMMCTRCLAAEATRFIAHPDDQFGEPPKQHVGPRIRMSSEEERRRRLKRKLDHAAKRARKHSKSTVTED